MADAPSSQALAHSSPASGQVIEIQLSGSDSPQHSTQRHREKWKHISPPRYMPPSGEYYQYINFPWYYHFDVGEVVLYCDPYHMEPYQGHSYYQEPKRVRDMQPPSNAIDNHPPSPSEDFTSYSQMISRMAKSLQLHIKEPPSPEADLIFNDIIQERTPPFRLTFIPSMLKLIQGNMGEATIYATNLKTD